MTVEAVTVCEPCGGTEWEIVHRDVMGRGVDLRRCVACGFKTYDRILMDPREVYDQPDHAERFFRFGSAEYARQRPECMDENHAAARSMYGAMLVAIEAHIPARPFHLFEVGCAWGRFIGLARERGVVVAGCDLNPHEAANAQSLGLSVSHADFLEDPLPQDWDAVVMLDVLEHVWRPRRALERARDMLVPGGVLLIKTFYDEYHDTIALDLSGQAADLGAPDAVSHGYFDPLGHPCHFDEPVLLALIERVGLRILSSALDPRWGQITVLARRP